ncbi:hypothetical protein OUZ56_011888 [Daphnia magna]|uniref:Uncharacterized protein n=1 Tax=Daphnia magna TaxID=35525 RepID=A0ABQ9Z2R1_9CRUS|nr:hypothetical protein OUZ56_011888 [Daphnia magna]
MFHVVRTAAGDVSMSCKSHSSEDACSLLTWNGRLPPPAENSLYVYVDEISTHVVDFFVKTHYHLLMAVHLFYGLFPGHHEQMLFVTKGLAEIAQPGGRFTQYCIKFNIGGVESFYTTFINSNSCFTYTIAYNMYKINVSLQVEQSILTFTPCSLAVAKTQSFVTGRINEFLLLTSFTLTTLTKLSAALGIISITLPNGHCPRKSDEERIHVAIDSKNVE